MYGWIFRHLPGPLPVRILIALGLIAAVAALLLTVVFPWFEQISPLHQDVTLDPGALGPGVG